jgi:hypothetical protein
MLPPTAKDVIDDICKGSDHVAETLRRYARSFPITNMGFQMFNWKLQSRITSDLQYLEVI